jgi:hypothetical protein
MRAYRTVLMLILCFVLPCIAQAQTAHLPAAEAKNHVGESATSADVLLGFIITIHHEIPEIVINTPGQLRIQK